MNDLTAVMNTAMSDPIIRANVIDFEKLILAHPAHLTAKDFVTKHHFAPGIYMRELHIPKGMIVVGKIHKHPCLAMLVKGKLKMPTYDGLQFINALHISYSPAGIKRVAEAMEDSIFITVHSTSLTDIDELERALCCDSEEEYQQFLLTTEAPKCLS